MAESELLESFEDSDAITSMPAKKKKKWYHQNFREEWLDDPEFADWLQPDENDRTCSYCIYCKASLKHANRSMLMSHKKTSKHKKYTEGKKGAKDTFKVEMLIKRKKLSEEENVARAGLLLAGFFTEHRLSYHNVGHLVEVLKKAFVNSTIARKSEIDASKLAYLIQDGIAYHGKLEISEICQNQKFSILINLNSDPLATQLTAIVVRFFDTNKQDLVDVLFDTVTPDTDTVESLYNAVKLLLISKNIPLDNIIGYGSNNCLNDGFYSLLKADVPTVFTVACDWNSMSICFSQALKVIPSDVETFLHEVSLCFVNGGKALMDYGMNPELVRVTQLKLQESSQTVRDEYLITVILEQWQTLLIYFQAEVKNERDNDLVPVYNTFIARGTKHMLTFLQYILQKINSFNIEFYSEEFRLHMLHTLITNIYREFLGCFILDDVLSKYKLSEIDPTNVSIQKDLDDVYFGASLMTLFLQEPLAGREKPIKAYFLQFLIELSCQIRANFSLAENGILASLDILDPTIVQSHRKAPPSLAKLALHFPNLVPENKLNELDDQWRAFRISKEFLFTEMSIPQYWFLLRNVKDATGKSKFALLSQFMTNLAVLPHSSASVEKIFCQINVIKGKYKSVLKAESAKDRLIARQMLVRKSKTCSSWEPSKELITDAAQNTCLKRKESRLELYRAMPGMPAKDELMDIDQSDESDREQI
ncbi:Uncharacterized protein BgiBS90_027013 [Biomphalaria glabrata]|uniref:HAT C-terminal dimerisation domain-containing protein n=2 Tax=Biomphalaria TaxID=6525 RepID=A0A2C9KRH8_BIOGL|nr:Uncharacterized protein BgiBS90_027013 [Biomphalaria glabrata]